jgi:hypothetical protein
MRTATVSGGRASVLVDVPERRYERMRGLIGRTSRRPMLFLRTRSVHTVGMREPIWVTLLDRRFGVVAVVALPPRRILVPRRGVRHLLESRERAFDRGERLVVRPSGEPGANES